MALNVEFHHQSKRVKVTPGTTMFQVLEEARGHFGLDATRQFQLLHRSKPIDLSIPFRLTGISNNALVELQELEGAAEVQQVRVCIQLRDGKRVQASFGSDTTIERILTFFKLLPAAEQFSLGFLRREIDFQAFTVTTLKVLGILSGSAMFRVQVADGQLAPTVPKLQITPAPHVSFAPPAKTPSPPTKTEAVSSAHVHHEEDVEMKEISNEELTSEEKAAEVKNPSLNSFDALQLLRDNSFDAVSRTAVITLMKIVTNILSDPGNEKMRSIRLSNAAFQRSVVNVKGGLEFLKSIGFVVVPETQVLVLSPASNEQRVLEEGLRLLHAEANDLYISPDKLPTVSKTKEDPDFDVFKTQITRVQMQPRGPSTTEVLVDTLRTKQDQLVGREKPPRNTSIALEGRRSGGRIELSDVATESERSDAQLLISSLKARREEMEKAKNFRTQAMRELDELKRKKVFQSALIRVQFPDRAVMQASFHPNETIQDVMDHVSECLNDQFKHSKFYLYVTPPTQKLAATKSLAELNLVPAALTYLSWLEMPPQTEVTNIGFYFRSDLLVDERAESKETPDPLESVNYPKPLTLDNPLLSAKTEPRVEPKQQPSSSGQPKSGKKPSWLKL